MGILDTSEHSIGERLVWCGAAGGAGGGVGHGNRQVGDASMPNGLRLPVIYRRGGLIETATGPQRSPKASSRSPPPAPCRHDVELHLVTLGQTLEPTLSPSPSRISPNAPPGGHGASPQGATRQSGASESPPRSAGHELRRLAPTPLGSRNPRTVRPALGLPSPDFERGPCPWPGTITASRSDSES
jgi:hypothetical protein